MMSTKQLKILCCNYRYFITGGPERYLFSLAEVLKNNGHQLIPFSVKYEQNVPTPFSKYFVNPPGDGTQVTYKDLQLSFWQKAKFALNSIYSFEALNKIKRVIENEKPDIAYLLELHNVISPSVINGCAELNLPIVMRLSEYHLMCPAYHFFRNNHICEECRQGFYHAIKYSCLQNSRLVSTTKAIGSYYYKLKRIYDKVRVFITPSNFMREKLIEFGFDGNKIIHIPTFIDVAQYNPGYDHQDYVLYFGRLTKEKGVWDLIKAVEPLSTKLFIIGNSTDGEDILLKEYVEKKRLDHIQFLGFKDGTELHEIIRGAMFTVCPSIWYENTPISIYESLALGKPVIATNIGSLTEQVIDGENGLLFNYRDIEDLREKIQYLAMNKHLLPQMGRCARQHIEKSFNSEVHYQKLIVVFNDLISNVAS